MSGDDLAGRIAAFLADGDAAEPARVAPQPLAAEREKCYARRPAPTGERLRCRLGRGHSGSHIAYYDTPGGVRLLWWF